MSSNVISIDGPCYVGKSTIARELSTLMGYKHINTGHMYRAVAKKVLHLGIPLEQRESIINIANDLEINFKLKGFTTHTIIDGEDLTNALDLPEIDSFTPKIALIPELRQILMEKQRSYANTNFVILEGRDIGTVVFPDAIWKFFITASLEVRAKRMQKLLKEKQLVPQLDKKNIIQKIIEIDKTDRNRVIAPLKMAKDAMLYDNSDSPSELQDAFILQYYINHSNELIKNVTIIKKIKYDEK